MEISELYIDNDKIPVLPHFHVALVHKLFKLSKRKTMLNHRSFVVIFLVS